MSVLPFKPDADTTDRADTCDGRMRGLWRVASRTTAVVLVAIFVVGVAAAAQASSAASTPQPALLTSAYEGSFAAFEAIDSLPGPGWPEGDAADHCVYDGTAMLVGEPQPPSVFKGEQVATESNGAGRELVPWKQYPLDRGFLGNPVADTLQPGARISRFGSEQGTFASPENVPFSQRGLPPEAANKPYGVYEVVRPVDAQGGIAQYWMGSGGGVQYEFSQSIEQLIQQGILKRVG